MSNNEFVANFEFAEQPQYTADFIFSVAPNATSQLINDSGFITLNDVGNGKLTIIQDGVELGTFYANDSENKTIQIPKSINSFAKLEGSPYDNTNLANAFNLKAERSALNELSSVVDTKASQADLNQVSYNLSVVSENLQDVETEIATYGDIVTHDSAEYATSAQGSKADSAIQPNDNVSELTNDADYQNATQVNSAVTSHHDSTKQDTISDLATIRTNAQAGKNASDTIANYGDIVTHDVDEFATSAQGSKADSAIQPNDNVSELTNDSGYITGIDSSDVTTALGYTPYNSANPNGYQTSTQVNSAIQTHNVSTTAHEDIRDVAEEALQRASQAVKSIVVDTFADMETWLKDVSHKGELAVGDNIYIKDVTVDDYWVSAVLETPDATTGYYYEISPLSGEKPHIDNMVTTDTNQTISGDKNFTGSLSLDSEAVATESYVTSHHDSTKQDTISDLATIRSNASVGKTASDTIATYGNIVTHNTSEFATSAQGAKADSAVQPATLSGYVPTSRKINGQALTQDLTIERGLVDDVKVNGTSVVTNKVANISATAIKRKRYS